MTTDPFTDAADDAAEQSTRGFIGTNEAAYGYLSGFTAGAEWARTHLAAQEETDHPTRPEGAEEWEDWLINNLAHESLTDQQMEDLANRVVQLITEE